MATEAKYANGESVIAQTRSTSSVELGWEDGQTGYVPINTYVPSGGGTAVPVFYHHMNIMSGASHVA